MNEREKFERHIDECIVSAEGLDEAIKKDGENYYIPWVQGKWLAWQAAKTDSAAEIAALKHQVSEQALKYLSAMGQWDELEADLRQRLEVAERDAARYQWLRDNVEQVYARPRTEIACDWGMKWQIKPYLVAVSAVATDVTFDAAIDAAMKEQK